MRAHDVTLAIRTLFQRPGFTVAAILLLALGAGANAAVFSVVRGILLRPLPYPEPDRLVAVWPGHFVSNLEIGYVRDRARGLEQIATQSPGWMMALVAESGEPLKVTGARVSENLFTTLGVSARVGRTIQPGDGPSRVAVLAHSLWQSRFGGDVRVLGRRILIDEAPYEVIGVMPDRFEIFEPGTDLWTPLPFDPSGPMHKATFSLALGRLAPGTSLDAVSRELQALAGGMRAELGKGDDWGRDISVISLRESIVGDIRPTLLILLGAVGLILLLAAVNLGTLLLGRSVARAREMAVRTALGASWVRLLRQLLVEQAVLATCGALVGLLLARAALPVLVARIPTEMPRVGAISLDGVVFVSVLGIAILVAVLMALMPALLTIRPSIQSLLRQTHSTETPGRRRALGLLAATQIALAVVLGIGAGLMLRSVWNLQRVEPGFKPDHVLTFRLQTTSKHRTLATGLPYLEQVVERVRALPGVTAVGSIGHLPLSGYSWTIPLHRADQPVAPGTSPPLVGWRFIGWDYFAAMMIPVQYGRVFTLTDRATSTPVGIVNETLARGVFGKPAAALGQIVVQKGGARPGDELVEIVGVVADVRHRALESPPQPEVYRPLSQTFMFPMAFVVHTSGPPAQLGAAVRQAAYAVDPTVPVAELQPLSAMLAHSIARPRTLAMLLTVFAAVGVLLGVIGVYGVVAYRVRQREREFGIRLALGATPGWIARSVVRQGARQALAGLAIGVPAALGLGRLMQSVLFGVATYDPFTFVALPVLVACATLAACVWPARRAASIEPATSMRQE